MYGEDINEKPMMRPGKAAKWSRDVAYIITSDKPSTEIHRLYMIPLHPERMCRDEEQEVVKEKMKITTMDYRNIELDEDCTRVFE